MWKLVLCLSLLLAGSIARAGVVFEQPLNGSGALHASSWLEPDGSDSDMYAFDNFRLATAATISEVRWYGGYIYNAPYGRVWNFKFTLYPSILGDYEPDILHPLVKYKAGNNCHETLVGTYGGKQIYSYSYAFPKVFNAQANKKYWIQIEASQVGYPDWGLADGLSGEGHYFNFSTGAARYYFLTGDTAFSLVEPDASQYTISAVVDPSVCGSLTGTGTFSVGATVHLSATPNPGYKFVNWTENGTVVGTSNDYIFQATADRSLVANMVPTLTSIKVMPNPVPGGVSPTGTVTIAVPAPVDTPVEIVSDMPVGVGVTNPVWIPAGSTSATFAMTSYPWNTDYQVWITANLGPVSKTTPVIVKAPTPKVVTLTPKILTGGASATLAVSLTSMAPQMGYQVWLTSDNPAVTVPNSLSFNPWVTDASCVLATKPVVIDTVVNITATANGVSKSASLTIKAGIPTKIACSPASVVGGKASTLTVTMSGPAPDPADLIWLSSSNACVIVPQNLAITPGATQVSCTVATLPVGVNTAVTITVLAHGVSKSATLTVKAPSPSAVSFTPSTVAGGSTTVMTVKLNGAAPSAGYLVNLSSSDPAVSVPATVTVPAGKTSATLVLSTSAVATQKLVTVSATANGITKSAVLTVN
jgi:hypothetical protein